ncbi:MAG TPA: hypothetical protein VFG79_02880, partial [Solirubrobacter sp.]|nr:hypothetical protein [Solirubrobacter sp.]
MRTTLAYAPSVRGDAMLLTHGREGTELLIGAALLLDGVLAGVIDVVGSGPDRRRPGAVGAFASVPEALERRRVVAGAELPDTPSLLAELRDRVLA